MKKLVALVAAVALAGCRSTAKPVKTAPTLVSCGWVEKHIPELRGGSPSSAGVKQTNDRAIATCSRAATTTFVRGVYSPS